MAFSNLEVADLSVEGFCRVMTGQLKMTLMTQNKKDAKISVVNSIASAMSAYELPKKPAKPFINANSIPDDAKVGSAYHCLFINHWDILGFFVHIPF